MNNDTQSKRSDAIAEEAAEYFVALKTSDVNTKVAFAGWLKISPEHVKEFLTVAALWDRLPEVSAQPTPEELIRLAAGDKNVIALSQSGRDLQSDASLPSSSAGAERATSVRAIPGRCARWLGFAAAAALTAVMIGGAIPQLLLLLDPNLYRTAIGEQTSVSLPDGSVVTLNTQSTLRVVYSGASRVIHLTEGEALFDVAKDPTRPFRVMTGTTVIEAVGTEFNVRSLAEDVTVTVVEGVVDVSAKRPRRPLGRISKLPDRGESPQVPWITRPVRITAGQQARIESNSGQVAVVETAVEQAVAWQQRRLIFEHLSLKDVIDEFNRYNDPPIVIADPTLRDLPISGVFRSNDRESFVQFLSQMNLAESHTRDDGTVVLRRAQGD